MIFRVRVAAEVEVPGSGECAHWTGSRDLWKRRRLSQCLGHRVSREPYPSRSCQNSSASAPGGCVLKRQVRP